MNNFQFGRTSTGLPILGYQFGHSGPEVLILGGVHGNEPEGVQCALGLIDKFQKKFTFALNLTVVPMFNTEGVIAGTRVNSSGVDLNRNLPTKDWDPKAFNKKYPPGPFANSEPENHALVKFIDTRDLKFVISLHSFTQPMLNVNGNCEPEAEIISRLTGYKKEESIGYPTPGCLGTYTGLERGIPTITYEIERGIDTQKVLGMHVPAICEALKRTEERK